MGFRLCTVAELRSTFDVRLCHGMRVLRNIRTLMLVVVVLGILGLRGSSTASEAQRAATIPPPPESRTLLPTPLPNVVMVKVVVGASGRRVTGRVVSTPTERNSRPA